MTTCDEVYDNALTTEDVEQPNLNPVASNAFQIRAYSGMSLCWSPARLSCVCWGRAEGAKAAALEDAPCRPQRLAGRSVQVFGTRKIKDPNCIWYGDLRTNRKKKGGGNLFSGTKMGLHLETCIGPG